MNTEQENESPDIRKIRDLMKKLEKEKAPWYFDARLRQRLTDTTPVRRSFIFRPAFGFPLAAALTAVVLYLSLPDAGETLPGLPPPENPALDLPRQGPGSDNGLSRETEGEAIEDQDYHPADGSPQRGPSGGFSDPFVPSTIAVPQRGGGNNPVPTPLAVPETAPSLQMTLEADTLDSLDTSADSLLNHRH